MMKRTCIAEILLAVSLLSLAGCAIRRETDSVGLYNDTINIGEGTAKVFKVEPDYANAENILNTFFKMSVEDASECYYRGAYEIDGKTLGIGFNNYILPVLSGGEYVEQINYWDNNEGAYDCYNMAIGSNLSEWRAEDSLRDYLPSENLDACTKEEAIEACQPYADVLGYQDAEVSVYAVTLDVLMEGALQTDFSRNGIKEYYSAPGPGYTVITRKQYEESDEQELLLEDAVERGIDWEKKHEVMLLTYQPVIEGYVMTGVQEFLYILYSPLYKTPIEITGEVACEAVNVIEELPLISQADAVGRIVLMKGYSSVEDMEVKKVSLVYALQTVTDGDEALEKAIPCWKVEYKHNNVTYRELIDAVYGDEYVRYPGV